MLKVDKMDRTLQAIKQNKIVMIYRGLEPEVCLEASKVLYEAGIRLFEVTMNSPGTEKTIELLHSELGPDVFIGAGTVIKPSQVDKAAQAGATYIISPNVNEDVIIRTKELGMVSIPGAMTPTEVDVALESGGDIVKIFPINILSSTFITEIKNPFDNLEVLPSGGIRLEMVEELFQVGSCAVGVGVQLLGRDLVKQKQWDLLKGQAKKYLEAAGV